MWEAISSGIRNVIGAITGLRGYKLVWEGSLEHDAREREELYDKIHRLEKKYDKLRKKKYKEFLGDYKYAILVPYKSIHTELWNEGRIEEHVRAIDFHVEPNYIPELHIEK